MTLCCPGLKDLPPAPRNKSGWPWTQECKALPDQMPEGSNWPRVSIVTPSYNQGRFIEESIRSVLLQGYPDLEYIIIDGGSDDESVDIIKKYEPWLSYWESKPDRGQSHAINKGLQKCTGKLFNWHNSDDVLTPNSLARTVEVMTKFSQAGYVHGDRIIIDENSVVQGDTRNCYGDKVDFLPTITTVVSTLRAGCQPGCLMNRDIVTELGMADENLHYIMDVDLLVRTALLRPPVYVPFPVVCLRVHAAIKSAQWNAQRAKEKIVLARKIFCSRNLAASIKRLKRCSFAKAHQYAWICYAGAGKYGPTLWHFAMDVFYTSGRGWRERLGRLRQLLESRQENAQLWQQNRISPR